MSADRPQMQADRSAKKRKPKARIRTLGDLDRRTRAARDAEELRDRIAADLGGWDEISAMSEELLTGAALLGAVIRDRATSFLSGERVDLVELMSLTNAQRRLIADLGLDRQPINVTRTGAIIELRAPELQDSEGRSMEAAPTEPDQEAAEEALDGEWQEGDPLPTVIEFVTPESGTRAPQAPPRDED